jgi:hypothetical protein
MRDALMDPCFGGELAAVRSAPADDAAADFGRVPLGDDCFAPADLGSAAGGFSAVRV